MAWNPSPEVAVARDVANKLGVDQVVLVTVSYSKNELGTITYGANKKLCQHAAQLGKAAYRAVFKAMEDGEFDTIEQADECDDGLAAQYKHRYGGRK